MNPHKLTYGFAYSFPFAQLIGGVTLIGLLTGKQKKLNIWSRETIVLLMLIIWICITTVFAANPDGATDQLVRFLKIQLFIFISILLLSDKEKLNGFIWVMVLSIGFYSVKGGIFTILTGGSSRVWGPEGTFIGGNNEIALAMLMTVPLMWYLYTQTQKRWIRMGLIAAMVLTSTAILGSQSRGAFLGIVAIGIFFWLKSRQKFKATLLVAVVAGMLVMLMPQSWVDRMNTIQTYQQDSSAESRINAWTFAWNVGNHKLFGGGANMFVSDSLREQYSPNPGDYHDMHSIYFQMLGDQGWIGFALFMLLGLFTWFRCSQIVRYAQDHPERQWSADLALMLQVSLIGYAVSGAFLGLAYFDYYYDLVAATVVAWKLTRVNLGVENEELNLAAEGQRSSLALGQKKS
jgi:probable O-glycosylation ligase (exosortase A-associated)